MTLPLALPGIFAGSLLTFIPAVGDFINAQLLGTSRQYMIGNVIQSKFLVVARLPGRRRAVVRADGGSCWSSSSSYVRALGTRNAAGRGGVRRARTRCATRLLGRLGGAGAALPVPPDLRRRLFSFNDNKGRFNLTWQGFTLDHWKHPFRSRASATALRNSLVIAAISTVARGGARAR